ncbi:hypothetical protein [Nostoc sp. NMS4]|uniref:hypothetical protein n=1 Tax=Nostoc sp. NMS4 TaxID=2815390 RepID=UPI0025E7B057|nr:hypothetical protein [Nostoc sp. NMS4]MBN3926664.1 hypothetical protein [Nostoc sp. NMS4]
MLCQIRFIYRIHDLIRLHPVLLRGYLTTSLDEKRLRANRPITLNKNLTIDGIDIPGLTING